MSDRLWYVAYGANTSSSYLANRLSVEPGTGWEEDAWLKIAHSMYFGGHSQTWNGSAVAFVKLESGSIASTVARAYLLTWPTFQAILAAEHRLIPLDWDAELADLKVGAWCPLPTQAKYNAVLRLRDYRGRRAYTITTARYFARRRPGENYLSKCREGLRECPTLGDVDRYLEPIIEDMLNEELESVVPPLPGAPLVWSRSLSPLASTGYPTVRLGEREAWLNADGPFPAEVVVAGRRARVWLLPPADDCPEGASPQVFRALGFTPPFPEGLPSRMCAAYAVSLSRLPGTSEDIEIADHLQVAPRTAELLGSWALLIAPSISGPVRLSARKHVPPDAIRIPYAARELWELEGDTGEVSILPLDEATKAKPPLVTRLWRTIMEALLGAPAVPLRATEAVVGDEGRAVVRIDGTALDFLGIQAGQQVIVSWAERETTARVLLQTDELRDRMRKQLAQSTGRQSRLATRAATEQADILWHLQVWVSPAVRDALVIPPDTVVRLRRSVSHLVLRNLIALQLPIAGLILGRSALPGISWGVWLIVSFVALLITFVPLRLPKS